MYNDLSRDVRNLTGARKYTDSAAEAMRDYDLDSQLNLKEANERLARYNALKLKYAKDLNKQLKKLSKSELEEFNKEFARQEQARNSKSLKQQSEYYKKLAEIEDDADKKSQYSKLARQKEFQAKIADVVKKSVDNTLSGIQRYMGTYTDYMGEIEARLQGSTKSFEGVTSTIKRNLSTSPYVKQTEVFNQLRSLISEGIAYNVEQRAFLGTISKNIATTFNVANSALLQLVRIQQADTTAARLGLEASLTKYFNAMFGDTSYLNQTFKTVSSTLLGSTSQLGARGGVEYEYAVQKWLGSLGSLGVNESTLTSIAQGINALGTGDITSLAGNQSMQRLLLMGAQRGGVSYTSALQSGLSAQDANKLLGGVVSYIQEIARSQNNVVKSQFGNLFGVTLSDMTAILNLSSQDLKNISQNMLSYGGAIKELNDQLGQVGSRLSVKQKLDNLIENALVGAAENISNQPLAYLGWTAADLMQKSGLDIALPAIMGTDLKQTVAGVMKMGIAGGSLITNLVYGVANALTTGGSLGLDTWGIDGDITTRGKNVVSARGMSSGTSTTIYGGGGTSDEELGRVAKESTQYKSAEADSEDSKLMEVLRDNIATDVRAILGILQNGFSIRGTAGGGLTIYGEG